MRALSAPNFDQPFSGTYWQIAIPGGGTATSRSLWDSRLPPFDLPAGAGPRVSDIPGLRGEVLRLAERSVVPEEGGPPMLVQVAVARDTLDRDIGRLRLLVGGSFLALGLGLVGGVAAQVVWGLAPLRRARRALAALRAGEATGLGAARAPAEIAPLLAEIDALVAQNRATVERARAHVGNLAHALKTPLAVQRTALEAAPADLGTARAQATAMEHLVQHHLVRARAAALSGAAATEAVPLAVADSVARALRRLFAGKGLEITVAGDARARMRVDHQDLAEMLGNLLENACAWAAQAVRVTVAREGAAVLACIEDDGPGLTEAERAAVLARGARLDEAAPGSGLGLAIVCDLAGLYGGSLMLEAATQGGLRACLRLPAA
ncbi:sensor histidine kinase [Dankookia sp. P2]|uniref:sensor histidine kinase n=1 Tax=Dankookia sp. P2 TaxID=3423955 RepID=UPI003D673A43